MARLTPQEVAAVATRLAREPDVLVTVELGIVDYDTALETQEALRDLLIAGEIPELLLLMEHPPVYTLGRGATREHLGAAAASGVPVRRVGRGGEVTFHGPGQLVGYPIVDLSPRGRDVHAHIRRLESALIRAAARFGVTSGRIAGLPGAWVKGRKLASIGVGVKRWVTNHGFGLNVTTDLAYFDRIVPCGLWGVKMTSLLAEGADPSLHDVGRCVARELATELELRVVRFVGDRVGEGRPPQSSREGTDPRSCSWNVR